MRTRMRACALNELVADRFPAELLVGRVSFRDVVRVAMTCKAWHERIRHDLDDRRGREDVARGVRWYVFVDETSPPVATSVPFVREGHAWTLSIFRQGNVNHGARYLRSLRRNTTLASRGGVSCYLKCEDCVETKPVCYYFVVTFGPSIDLQHHLFRTFKTTHAFTPEVDDWGFSLADGVRRERGWFVVTCNFVDAKESFGNL